MISGGAIVLAVNTVVAGMFACSYVIVAQANRSQRRALWFGLVYAIGMISPVADFLTPFTKAPDVLEVVSYASFLAATLGMSAAFSGFQRRRPPWEAITVIFAVGIVVRMSIRGSDHGTLAYGFAYQLPLILASLLAVRSVLCTATRDAFHRGLATVFCAIALNLAIKPFLAVRYGPGASFREYSATSYSVFSQSSTGFLLLAAGIILLLIVAQQAILTSQRESETDALSGLANRRGFDRLAQDLLTHADREGRTISMAMFDLDHFKRINDTYGHDRGDEVIAAFGHLLRTAIDRPVVSARLGGEEFAILLEEGSQRDAWLVAERIRLAAARLAIDDRATISISGGVAERRRGEGLAQLMRRADHALYDAKNSGRDRICGHPSRAVLQGQPGVVVSFPRRRVPVPAY